MKKYLLVLCLFPSLSFAQDIVPAASVSDQESAFTTILRGRCMRFSDHTCYNRTPGSICIIDPARGRNGVCRQIENPDSNGDFTCRCI